jgi:UDP-glucose 4-epimerase
MAEVLVTGATGLLGSKVVEVLAGEHRVTALARRHPPTTAPARWLVHDLARPDLPEEMPAGIDVVIHLAQSRRFREFPEGAADTFAVNVASTARLLDWAVGAGARRFVLASTGGVYSPASAAHREDEPTPPDGIPSFYAASKLAAELVARSYGSLLTVCVLRPFFVYGRGQDRGMLLPRLADRVKAGEPVVVDGHDGMQFNPVHVSDAARAVVAATEVRESCVVNVAGPEVLSLRRAVELIGAHLGTEPKVEVRPGSVAVDVIGDTGRMEALLARPATVLAEAVAEVCA